MRIFQILSLLVLVACSSDQAPLVATDVRITAPVPGMVMSAGYLTLHNNTREPITITRVTSPQFGAVEMHETRIEEQVSRMVAMDELTIPSGSAVTLEPGGKHLMLMQPAGELDTVTLDFHSDTDVVLTLTAAVVR